MRPCPVFTLYYTRAHPPFQPRPPLPPSFFPLPRAYFFPLPSPSLFLPYSHSKTLLQIYRVYFRPDSVPVPDFARNITRILSSPRRFLFVPNFNNLGRAKGKKKKEEKYPAGSRIGSVVRNNRGEIQSFLSPRRDESGERERRERGIKRRGKGRRGRREHAAGWLVYSSAYSPLVDGAARNAQLLRNQCASPPCLMLRIRSPSEAVRPSGPSPRTTDPNLLVCSSSSYPLLPFPLFRVPVILLRPKPPSQLPSSSSVNLVHATNSRPRNRIGHS